MNPLRQIEQEGLAPGRELTRLELQKRLQKECDTMPMECGQTGQPLEHTRWRKMKLDTVAGSVELRAQRGYEPEQGKWICPARAAWGLSPYERKTPELQARLAYTATAVGSYAEAETTAGRRTILEPSRPDFAAAPECPRNKPGSSAPLELIPTATFGMHRLILITHNHGCATG